MIVRCWYHREAVGLSSSLSGSFPGCQKCSRAPTSITFLPVNKNAVILKCQLYLKTDMVFVFHLTPHKAVSVSVLRGQRGYEHRRQRRPSAVVGDCSVSQWDESDTFKVCSSWHISLQIPWSFCNPVETKPVFGFISEGSIEPRGRKTFLRTESEKPKKMFSLCFICSGP